jgi:hypothetical protein
VPVNVTVEEHLPTLYSAAEATSTRGQDRFRKLTATSLCLLIVAAAGGLIEHEWAGWLSLTAFGASLVTTGLWIFRHAETNWYDGRAAAESVKSLTWKYAVRGDPFSTSTGEAEVAYRSAIEGLVEELRELGSDVRAPDVAARSAALDAVRSAPLAHRRDVYRAQRVTQQRDWYARRARDHRVSSHRWHIAMFGCQSAGTVGALLKALGSIHADVLSLLATAAVAAAAWVTAGDFVRTARAYDFAALELDGVLDRLDAAGSEDEWASFVADAEQAMSREHTVWLARRRGSV